MLRHARTGSLSDLNTAISALMNTCRYEPENVGEVESFNLVCAGFACLKKYNITGEVQDLEEWQTLAPGVIASLSTKLESMPQHISMDVDILNGLTGWIERVIAVENSRHVQRQ